MSPSEALALADHLDDARAALWPLASSRPQRAASRAASRVRAALAEVVDPLHELVRALDLPDLQLVEPPCPHCGASTASPDHHPACPAKRVGLAPE